MRSCSVLVVDDEPDMLETCRKILDRRGYRVVTALSGETALEAMRQETFDLVLADLRLPDIDGLGVLRAVKRQDPGLPVIIFTAYATIETALQAVREGAFDYIAKPFSKEQLELLVERSLEHQQLVEENKRLRRELQTIYDFSQIVGKSPSMVEVLDFVTKIAATDAGVLICGESGTGKELIAHAIHVNSPRRKAGFVPIDCAALPETLLESELFGYEKGAFTGAIIGKRGLLETAHGGTLFLDEIGDLSLNIQAKLLRVLEERQFRRLGGREVLDVDIRLIAATNRILEELLTAGRFREDLFYRLNVVRISLPPLRERQSDIPLLANHFLAELCNRWGKEVKGISSAAMMILQNYHWPGNVRELRNAIEHALSMSESNQVLPLDFPAHVLAGVQAPTAFFSQVSYRQAKQAAVRTFERQYLEQALRSAEGKISKAATSAGIPRTTFHRLLRKHGLRTADFLPRSHRSS